MASLSSLRPVGASPAENLRGAGLMTASMIGFAFSDACLKLAGDHLPLFQILFLRGIGTTLVLVTLAARAGAAWRGLPRRDWGLIALRTLAEIGAAFTFITALMRMPIADLSAILQALPLTVTLAAALLLGERIGWRRGLAILVGFAGMLLILRPGAEGFGAPALLGLASVACVTLRDIASRRISAGAPSLVIAAATSGGVLAFGAAGLLVTDWRPVGAEAAAFVLGSVLFVTVGYVAGVAAMRVGDVAAVSPFRYASLLASILLGVAVFGTVPDALTLAGAAVVVASGLYTILRERRLARARGGA